MLGMDVTASGCSSLLHRATICIRNQLSGYLRGIFSLRLLTLLFDKRRVVYILATP